MTWAAAIPSGPQRLDAIDDHLLATGLEVALVRREAPLVEAADLLRAHSASHVAGLRGSLGRLAEEGGDGDLIAIDADTAANAGTWAAAQRAAGAAVAATDAVLDGLHPNAFCAVRPPGHHATPCGGDGLLLLQQRGGGGPGMRSRCGGSIGSRSSISTCTTATAPRTSSPATTGC